MTDNRAQTPTLYADSFALGITPADVEVALQLRGQTGLRLILPYSTAKELMNGLADTIGQFERATGQKIASLNETHERIQTIMPGAAKGKIIMQN